MRTENDAPTELKAALEAERLVPVIGAGVSMAAANLPGWWRLVESGIDYAEKGGACSATDLDHVRRLLKEDKLVEAAQGVKSLLRAPGGEYAAWLNSQFRVPDNRIVSKDLLNKIADLLCPIVATTNYDDLLERFMFERYESVTWLEPEAMRSSLRDGGAVFHLHGLFRSPKSVVFGADNYESLVADPAYEAVMRTLWMERTLLFVGCSFDGITDPDFSRMLSWFAETFPGTPHRHYAFAMQGSYTNEQAAQWLHDLRIQIIPYGPTHPDLVEALQGVNVNRVRAHAKRALHAKVLMESIGGDQVTRLREALTAMVQPDQKAAVAIAANELMSQSNARHSNWRGQLEAMQLLTRTLVDPAEIDREVDQWSRSTRFAGSFKETVVKAAGALFLYRADLLNALKRRGVHIHQRVLDGYCKDILQTLQRFDESGVQLSDPYWFENMNRILTSLQAILRTSPELLFPALQPAGATDVLPDDLLLVVWNDALEVRRRDPPEQVVATLPSDLPLRGASLQTLNGRTVVAAFTDERALLWDPHFPGPEKEFIVDTAFGINGVDHQHIDGELVSIVSTTDGPVHRLRNFQRVETWRPLPEAFLTDPVLLEDGRIFGLRMNMLPVIRTEPGSATQKLTADDLASEISRQVIVGDRWRRNVEEEVNTFGHHQENRSRLQNPRLARVLVEGRSLLTLHVQGSFYKTDELFLLLDPDTDPLQAVGSYVLPERLVASFSLKDSSTSNLSLLAAVLNLNRGGDALFWAVGAKTLDGIVFVSKGSFVPLPQDFVHVVHGAESQCFAADDRGGLFSFSTNDGSWREVDRRDKSRIHGLQSYTVTQH